MRKIDAQIIIFEAEILQRIRFILKGKKWIRVL